MYNKRKSCSLLKLPSFILLIILVPISLSAQTDSILAKLIFESDFRFRIEQDWNSKKSDGTFRDDRTRLRYRLRAGVRHAGSWYNVGFRIRTGDPDKQQDPQLTLGEGFGEFGTLPIGLEKAYFEGKLKAIDFWVGKNTFPFEKNNEMFWSDNVFPEGISVTKSFTFNSNFINYLGIKGGHFIMSASGRSLNDDNYFQGVQTHFRFLENRFELYPSLYLFKNVPNIPDGFETFKLDYSIMHIGTRLTVSEKQLIKIEFDYYHNLQDYSKNDSITSNFQDQKTGYVIGLKYGSLEQKGDWRFSATYAWLQQYSIVDIMAQNDWARWDYSAFGSPDGRLSNFNGVELAIAYKFDKKANLTMKYYVVEQLIPYGIDKETGSRIRLDLDVKF